MSVAQCYQLEQRALQGLVAACEALRRGRIPSGAGEAEGLRQENERIERECRRQQALVRLARQAAGLAPPAEAPAAGKRPRHGKGVRGRQEAQRLRQAAGAAQSGSEPALIGPDRC